jgi:carbon monoxide dehydrogenase subunit G
MTATLVSPPCSPVSKLSTPDRHQLQSLLNGEILLASQPYRDWGAMVTARFHLPIDRMKAWAQLTDYRRWVEYIPAISRSDVLSEGNQKRLYQVACKSFLLFTAQVEIYLNVVETTHQQIQFQMESGSFQDFAASLLLQDSGSGTLLTYSVQAIPSIPVPSILLQQAIQLDLPNSLQNLRRVICR